MSDKWYYELEELDGGEKVYISASVPIKPEKLCSFLGIEHLAKCNGMITEEKYLAETEE